MFYVFGVDLRVEIDRYYIQSIRRNFVVGGAYVEYSVLCGLI